MSKTDSSLRLLAILRFAIPSKSSRTLNATQAYDVTSSGITLASATGKLVDKDAAVKAYTPEGLDVGVGLSLGFAGEPRVTGDDPYAEKQPTLLRSTTSATLWSRSAEAGTNLKLKVGFGLGATTFAFNGCFGTGGATVLNKSKATNPNTFFYGAITVGTGDYKKWQGKYAVLKINTVTGKGVLRIYDDA